MPRSRDLVRIKAPAKINLYLAILKKRPDHYHDLQSVLQVVGLYDELTFERIPRGIHLHSTGEAIRPAGGNLVLRAARALVRRTGVTDGVRMELTKRIPVGAGMGGGSSDAAATLVGLNRLWKLRLNRQELARIGETLGSDVPFFLSGPMALVAGRGERVFPLEEKQDRWYVLINPGFQISTRWAYQKIPKTHPQRVRKRLERIPEYVRLQNWLTKIQGASKIARSRYLRDSAPHIFPYNGLESICISRHPVIQEMKHHLMQEKAILSLMTGSGPTVFGLFASRGRAVQAARKISLEQPMWRVWTAKGLRRLPFDR